MNPSPAIEALIREKASWLERYYDRIIGCEVVVEAPSRPRRNGSHYRVRIGLRVPGAELVVDRNPADRDDLHDLGLALRDSFDAARRQLEDFAQRQRGNVKNHHQVSEQPEKTL
jgi:ribosome-associated translation inhibitor RaiA